jgi:hypothetical protein
MPAAGTLVYNLRAPLCQAALRRRLPLVAHRTELADAGALLAYSSSQDEQLRRGRNLSIRSCAAPPRRHSDRAADGVRAGREPSHRPGARHPHPSDVLLRTVRIIE